jgi:hypothetical protein
LSWSKIWIYLIADFGGAAVAAGAFKVLNSAEDVPQPQQQTEAAQVAAPEDRYSRT